MTRNGGTDVVRLSKEDRIGIIGLVLTAMAIIFAGVAWAYNVLDARMTKLEASDIDQNYRIRSNEKEAEFSTERFNALRDDIGKVGDNVEELRKDLNTL